MPRMKKDYTNFNKNLKIYREKSGYTPNELATMLDIGTNTYYAYETKNREPSFSVLIKLAQILEVSIDELLGNAPNEEQQCINFVHQSGLRIKFRNGCYFITKMNFNINNLNTLNDIHTYTLDPNQLKECVNSIKNNEEYKNTVQRKILEYLSNEQLRKLTLLTLLSVEEKGVITHEQMEKEATPIFKLPNELIYEKYLSILAKYAVDINEDTLINALAREELSHKEKKADAKKASDNT